MSSLERKESTERQLILLNLFDTEEIRDQFETWKLQGKGKEAIEYMNTQVERILHKAHQTQNEILHCQEQIKKATAELDEFEKTIRKEIPLHLLN